MDSRLKIAGMTKILDLWMDKESSEIKVSPHFWFRRMHSLAGVMPLGAFLLEHIDRKSVV